MSMNKPDIEQIQRAVATSLHEHWVLFLVEGIILIILGLAAVVIPPIATLAVEILYGWLFLISGIVGLITTFRMRQAPGSRTRARHGLRHGMGNPVAADPRLHFVRGRAGYRLSWRDEQAPARRPAPLDCDRSRPRGSVVIVLLCGRGSGPLDLPQRRELHRRDGLRNGLHQSRPRTQHYHARAAGLADHLG